MAKKVANPQDVVAPVAPVSEKEPAAAVEALASDAKAARFARNFGDRPDEQITFTDGSCYLFRGTCLLTEDQELIAKIREVSGKYKIIETSLD